MIKRLSLFTVIIVFVTLSNLKGIAQTITSYSILSTAYDRANATFHPVGAIDGGWFLSRIQDLTVPLNPATIINYPNDPAYVVTNSGNNSFPGIIANHSINFTPSTGSPGLKLVTYRTYFTLPNLSATTDRFSLHFKLCADDAVDNVQLNGVQRAKYLSPTFNNLPAFPKPYMLDILPCDSDLVSGQNYIDVTIADAGGSIGYYAEIELFKTSNVTGAVISVNSATICPQQSVTLTASGATTYTWNTGQTGNSIIVSPSVTTTYTVNGNTGSCPSGTVTTVNVIPNSIINVSGNTLICEGQSSTLTAVGAPNYTWSSGDNTSTAIVTPLSTSSYSVHSAAGVCSNTAVITVTVIPQPVISVGGNTGICAGESTTLTATGAMTYTWNTGAITASVNLNPTGTSNYSVSGSVLSCSSTAVVAVTVNNLPLISQVFVKDADCGLSNGSVTLAVLPSASTYSWSNNSTTNPLHNVPAGNYSVSVSNNGCVTQTVVNIGQQSAPVITLLAIAQTSCGLANGSATVTANTTGNTYNWIPAAVSNTNMAYGLSAGNYTVSVINGNCYTDTVFALNTSTAIQVNSISIVPSDCGVNNGEIDLNAISGGTAPYSIYFNNTLTTSTFFDQLMSNTYTVTISDVFNCREDFLLSVPSNGDFTLYAPNTFTPNKDKVNDEWYVLGACIEEFKCDIFNRWGEKLVQLNNINEGWDGKYKGREVPDGVYVYLIEATVDGETINKAGHITLFR